MGRQVTVLATTNLTTVAGLLNVEAKNTGSEKAILTVKTSNLDTTPSLAVVVSMIDALGEVVAQHTMGAITTATVTRVLLGSEIAAAAPFDEVSDWPTPTRLRIGFTCSGAGASLDVAAGIDWL